jgi:hypothetical protein
MGEGRLASTRPALPDHTWWFANWRDAIA